MNREHHVPTGELLQALAALGFEPADRVQLRFGFEAENSRTAVDLARELRARGARRVHVGPRPLGGAASHHRWGVALRTPPIPLDEGEICTLEDEMRAIAARHSGRRYLGWRPMLEPLELKRRAS